MQPLRLERHRHTGGVIDMSSPRWDGWNQCHDTNG